MYTYLALGDSYTCGEAVPSEQAFPRQLVTQLRTGGVEIADPEIIAVTGWTTGELMHGIKERDITGSFDLVTLLIGVNNQYRGPAKGFTLDAYRPEFTELLQTAIHFAGGKAERVVVISVPDWSVTPMAGEADRAHIAAEIDSYNTVNKQISEQYGAQYVDITPLSRQAANDPSLIASDDLHFSGSMYTQWVSAILPKLDFLKNEATD
ncbi:MAG TPA: SGNH/GDSL hydrolase family protein [Candidatus Saccharimonadales bacterium]|nr:SGNH/GDSL hydrolase family protein [Candidatus Saccharimonadales bacterium]